MKKWFYMRQRFTIQNHLNSGIQDNLVLGLLVLRISDTDCGIIHINMKKGTGCLYSLQCRFKFCESKYKDSENLNHRSLIWKRKICAI